MYLHRATKHVFTGFVWCALAFVTAGPLAAQFTRPRPCAAEYDANWDVPYTYYPLTSGPLAYTFHFGQGFLDEEDYAAAAPTGVYQFGTIISTDGGGELDNAYIGATCYDMGMRTGNDTTWLPQASYSTPGGDFQFHEVADEYTAGGTDEATDGGVIYCDYDVYYDDQGDEFDVAIDCWEEYAE